MITSSKADPTTTNASTAVLGIEPRASGILLYAALSLALPQQLWGFRSRAEQWPEPGWQSKRFHPLGSAEKSMLATAYLV